jgi:hypothetical protein
MELTDDTTEIQQGVVMVFLCVSVARRRRDAAPSVVLC